MEALIQLLLTLVEKVPFLSESDKAGAVELVRKFADSVGQGDAVPPAPSDQPTPEPPPVVDPGPTAEPVPPAEQTPPPSSPEVAPDANAFAAAAADDVPGSP